MSGSHIKKQLSHLIEERDLLQKWTGDELASIIRDVGFSCTLCGKCCTTDFNGHVFLLDKDTEWVSQHNPELLIPAPEFELIDNEGSFYVSGYALRTGEDGSCPYLNQNRCRIYENRFAICRIYPYMLHREPDRRKNLVFRQISGLNEHGEYNTIIGREESLQIAKETVEYEKTWLSQMIRFYSEVDTLFSNNGYSHVRKRYDQQIKDFRKGEPVTVHVWYQGFFVKTIVRYEEYRGFGWP